MAASLPLSSPSLLLFLFLISSPLLLPSSSSASHQYNGHHPHRTAATAAAPFSAALTHIDHGRSFTKLELIQRSLRRSKHRLERLTALATSTTNRSRNSSLKDPVYVGDGEFLMNMSIGTPPLPFSAILDTGSDLIWTQCRPCMKCFSQPTPIFDPLSSSTYSNLSCSSHLCKDMNVFRCVHGCKYMYSYGDESSTEGFMATDTFTFLDTVKKPASLPNIGFGCGVNNQGSGLARGSGLVGLGRGPLSLVSQLGLPRFSYCLPSIGENKTGGVLFGGLADLDYASGGTAATHGSTPLKQNPFRPSLYYLSLEGISVGETLLPVSKSALRMREDDSGGMIIDSGTTITYIQKDVFDALKMEFTAQMKLKVSSEDTGLDLCFELPAAAAATAEIQVPKLKFHLEGEVELELPAANYMIRDERSGVACLAMAASSGSGMSIFGNIQQQNFMVVHDLHKKTLSFIPTQCDQFANI